MASIHSIVILVSFYVAQVWAQFNINAKVNNVVYWGQGPDQQRLLYYCQQPDIDAIALSFVNLFPAQANGFPGTNFGNQCSGAVYAGPGYNGVVDPTKDALQSDCPLIASDIAACQRTYGKKILLALGGDSGEYQLDGATDGVKFANELWGLFGPRNKIWVKAGLPRPFDVAGDATGSAVDGFTMDIENVPDDGSAGYIAFANQLRTLYPASPQTGLLLTAAPQCTVPDASLGQVIASVAFDALFIQFYNTAACSARAWVNANPNFVSGTHTFPSGGFTYDTWSTAIAGGASAAAKLYIGLPGSTDAVDDPTFYLNQNETANIVDAYFCNRNFGGVAIYDATYADENLYLGQTFTQWTKGVLNNALADPSVRRCSGTPAGESTPGMV
ncbi:chitin recognition protein [Diaporthe amygdali]|uniref:chitin recognition protein n=1 Tax=Phomopsis amygdali TaxID=1214568 RepID=UPI0022FF26D4|nr:chitin recognition protein [Diaporthe amygdali]KAJ0122781.1 chitin recognition protein [Diaporthe amygdali]